MKGEMIMNVKYLKPLPIEQEITIEEMYQHHNNRRYKQRAHMILLSAQGYSQVEIAKIVRVMPKTVAKFIEHYKKHGFLGLYDKPIPGCPPKITEDIQKHIDKYLQASPRNHGYNMSGWTISMMRYHLWIRFGISVCIETVRQWFGKIGYSLIVPRYLLLDANDKEVDEFQQEFVQLLSRAKQGEVVLLFMDESSFKMVPTLSRIWAKKGSKPMIPTHNDKRKVVITGGTNPLTGKTHFRLSTNATKEAALAFLKQIRRYYPDAEIVILLDRSRSHKSHIVREYVVSDKRMHLILLPKYSPKLNKQEDIWKWFRKRVSHNFLFDNPKALANAIRDGYRYLQGQPERVLSLTGNM
jgi:transposase